MKIPPFNIERGKFRVSHHSRSFYIELFVVWLRFETHRNDGFFNFTFAIGAL